MNQSNRYGVIHIKPDWDAITFAYLARKVFGITEWKFVNQRNPDPTILAGAYIVGDVGMELNHETLRFDHHQVMYVDDALGVCATSLLFDYVMRTQPAQERNALGIAHLEPLIELVNDGDNGKMTPVMKHSTLFGMHADLSYLIHDDFTQKPTDEEILYWGFVYLQRKDRMLWNDAEWTRKAESYITLRHHQPYVVVVENSNAKVTKKILKTNKLVVFVNTEENMIGIQRQDGTKLNCGYVLQNMIKICQNWFEGQDEQMVDWPDGYTFDIQHVKDILDELTRKSTKWFAHESGFFSGRGTGGAKVDVPVTVNLDLLYYIVYRAYRITTVWSAS